MTVILLVVEKTLQTTNHIFGCYKSKAKKWIKPRKRAITKKIKAITSTTIQIERYTYIHINAALYYSTYSFYDEI